MYKYLLNYRKILSLIKLVDGKLGTGYAEQLSLVLLTLTDKQLTAIT